VLAGIEAGGGAGGRKTGRHQPTGQVTAAVAVVITVRAFGLLDALGARPGRPRSSQRAGRRLAGGLGQSRLAGRAAAAIQAAIRKGRDYAAALGGSLRSVEHIAGLCTCRAATSRPYITDVGAGRPGASKSVS
jgi:hypothetical protein